MIDMKKIITIIFTVLLAMVPLILIFTPAILAVTPVSDLLIVTLILGVLFQYASNDRVKNAVEEFTHWKIFDYITTALFIFGPTLIAYQTLILSHMSPAISLFATIAFGALSQYISMRRATAATPSITQNVNLEHDDDQGAD